MLPGAKTLTLADSERSRELQSQGTQCAQGGTHTQPQGSRHKVLPLPYLMGLQFHRLGDTDLLQQCEGPQNTLNRSWFTQLRPVV